MLKERLLLLISIVLIGCVVCPVHALADEEKGDENASNPLAKVNNTDLRIQSINLGGPDRSDFFLDGAYMVTPRLKLKYELHYWDTDVTGYSESDWESLQLKPIYFPEKLVGTLGTWKYKWAIGLEWIMGFGNEDKGIGSGSDQIAPFVGAALMKGKTVVVPLVQHFMEYNGPDVNQTAFRLISIQSLPNRFWGKLDAKLPVNWENDNAIPATIEVQFGKMFTTAFGTYVDGLVGIGSDRPYDWGVGVGLRCKY